LNTLVEDDATVPCNWNISLLLFFTFAWLLFWFS